MAIYCANATTSTSTKCSKGQVQESMGANNQIPNPSLHLNAISHHHNHHHQQNSMASYHQQASSARLNKASSTSLIMAINRFKMSVKDMKDTVLIPTRLGDLVNSADELTDISEPQDIYLENGHSHHEPSRTVHSCYGSVGSIDMSLALLSQPHNGSQYASSEISDSITTLTTNSASSSGSCSPIVSTISRHNLFEQYKLLDIIDKLLSSDTVMSVSTGKRATNNNILPSAFEDVDPNHAKHSSFCSVRAEEAAGINERRMSQHYYRNTKKMLTNTVYRSNSPDLMYGGFVNPKTRPRTDSRSNVVLMGGSLLNVKEKLEYHLVSLKNILHIMTSSADHITQAYLEDIHCNDRFEKQRIKLCDQGHSTTNRHYHTGNMGMHHY